MFPAKEGVDDWDKSVSFPVNASALRSISSFQVTRMRHVLSVVCVLVPLTALGGIPRCADAKFQRADLLTPEQWRSVLAEQADGDPVLLEAVEQEHVRSQGDPVPKGVPIAISWTQARTLILLGTVRTTYQKHDLKVILATHSGRRFITQEPTLDAVTKVVAEVDPCHAYIRQVTE
jgi:hypothetical protein